MSDLVSQVNVGVISHQFELLDLVRNVDPEAVNACGAELFIGTLSGVQVHQELGIVLDAVAEESRGVDAVIAGAVASVVTQGVVAVRLAVVPQSVDVLKVGESLHLGWDPDFVQVVHTTVFKSCPDLKRTLISCRLSWSFLFIFVIFVVVPESAKWTVQVAVVSEPLGHDT